MLCRSSATDSVQLLRQSPFRYSGCLSSATSAMRLGTPEPYRPARASLGVFLSARTVQVPDASLKVRTARQTLAVHPCVRLKSRPKLPVPA